MPDSQGKKHPPEARLRYSREFRIVRDCGRKKTTAHFLVFLMQKQVGETRLGITVSRKIGCSVQRNRIKRLIRESFRQCRQELPSRTDFSLIARRGAASLSYLQIRGELNILFGCPSMPEKPCSERSLLD